MINLTEQQADKQTDRQTNRQTYRQTDTKTDRQTHKQTGTRYNSLIRTIKQPNKLTINSKSTKKQNLDSTNKNKQKCIHQLQHLRKVLCFLVGEERGKVSVFRQSEEDVFCRLQKIFCI